jgi:succinyl-CoA synthetase beta subunit
MRLHEFEATDIFEASGIPVPRRGVAETVEEALHVGEKSVIRSWQRLKSWSVVADWRRHQERIESGRVGRDRRDPLGSEIKGLPVRKILVTEKAKFPKNSMWASL